jgi:hypothetical protein
VLLNFGLAHALGLTECKSYQVFGERVQTQRNKPVSLMGLPMILDRHVGHNKLIVAFDQSQHGFGRDCLVAFANGKTNPLSWTGLLVLASFRFRFSGMFGRCNKV